MLIHYRTIPYLDTLPSYTLSQFITELYPTQYITELNFQQTLWHNSFHKRHKTSAGVINSPHRNNFSAGALIKISRQSVTVPKVSHSARWLSL